MTFDEIVSDFIREYRHDVPSDGVVVDRAHGVSDIRLGFVGAGNRPKPLFGRNEGTRAWLSRYSFEDLSVAG